MQLNSLSISHLRNLHSLDLALNPNFNIFYGDNGSGKTSLLEAIHVLTLGRSFRVRQAQPIITFGKKSCLISGIVSNREAQSSMPAVRLGVERFQNGEIKIRLAEKDCASIASLAQILPIQLINTDSYELLRSTPQCRRQFLDWITFHVEHSFYSIWQRFKRALQQRNAALRERKSFFHSNVQVWDKDIEESGEIIDQCRQGFIQELIPIFTDLLKQLFELKKEITINYHPGWNSEYSLQEALKANLGRDQAWGYTIVGPQRADIEFLLDGIPAKNVLSRGQLKLFICGLFIARTILLYKRKQQHCVFLIDDLNSELDKEASRLLVNALGKLNSQIFITGIEAFPLTDLLKNQNYSLYEVNQGQIIQNLNAL